MSEAEITELLAKSAGAIDSALAASTGLRALSRKLITYWTLATHALPNLGTFPILNLSGKMGTGKSQALKIIRSFGFGSRSLCLRNMTRPAIRDEFAACHNGTVVIEEADDAWQDSESTFERLLSDRYQRDSAQAALKEPDGKHAWKTVEKMYFGATALHRRISFNDAALDGRTVTIRFMADHTRQYVEFTYDDTAFVEIARAFRDVVIDLPQIAQPHNDAARVFNTFKPLLAIAELMGDTEFLTEVMPILYQQTLELKEAQASEPDGLVLQSIVEGIFNSTPNWQNIKFSTLSDSIYRNHKANISPRQIGPLARELGFSTRMSHGVTVVVPSVATLLRACAECSYTDESIERLRADVMPAPQEIAREQVMRSNRDD